MNALSLVETASTTPSDGRRFLRLLADESRQAIVRLLALSDQRAGEIGALIRLPPNGVSYHLKQLRAIGLLRDRRSSADARDVYYQLDVGRLHALYSAAGDALYPGMAAPLNQLHEQRDMLPNLLRPLRVLFLCTHNSARSQMAEAILCQMGGDQVEAFSAGSLPTEVHPEALVALHEIGVDTTGLSAKSMEQFIGEPLDYIITVCDRVRDICPSFPGDPAQAHWSIADPAVVEDPERRDKAFHEVLNELQVRIRYLLLLPHPGTGERFHSLH
jgi:ArsR family transcriptional regulator, arsenate/arsenite/antimonite-responsive transcriptional repressor / arsenate reductase (thioredoxin)